MQVCMLAVLPSGCVEVRIETKVPLDVTFHFQYVRTSPKSDHDKYAEENSPIMIVNPKKHHVRTK